MLRERWMLGANSIYRYQSCSRGRRILLGDSDGSIISRKSRSVSPLSSTVQQLAKNNHMTKCPPSHAGRNKSTPRPAQILGRENASATQRVSRLCHCGVTCYYKRVHSLCFSTRSAAERDVRLADLNPQSARPKCQTAVVQEGSVSRFFANQRGLSRRDNPDTFKFRARCPDKRK